MCSASHASKKRHSQSPAGEATTVPVVDADFHRCYQVPKAWVNVPEDSKRYESLRVCQHYYASGVCSKGTKCLFVHLRQGALNTCPCNEVHTNRSWTRVEQALHPRHSAHEVFAVHRPKQWDKPVDMPGDHVLVTQGSRKYLEAVQRGEAQNPVPLCAHYLINRMCRLGEACNFVHYVTVDPTAVAGERTKKKLLPSLASEETASQCAGTPQGLLVQCIMPETPSPPPSARLSSAGSLGHSRTESTNSVPSPGSLNLSISSATVPLRVYTHNPYPNFTLYADDPIALHGPRALF